MMSRCVPAAMLLLMLLMAVPSCRKVVIDSPEKESFLTCSEIGLYMDGSPVFLYREHLHQMCSNSSRLMFRIQTNMQDTCMNVSLESRPQKDGDLVMSSLDWVVSGVMVTDMLQFECSRISSDRIWLWDGYTKTGVIIRRQ